MLLRRPVLSLLALCLITFFVGLGRQAITDSDEGFYAEAAREMVELGDWLTPRFNYEDRWQKPVLYYWLTAAAYLVTGLTEFSARLWAALSGVGLALVAWAVTRRMNGSDESAWLAGAIVATCFGCFAMARAALPDLPLAFFTTACIAATLRAAEPGTPSTTGLRWWLMAGLSGGLGFLMKGPVAVVIPLLVLLPIWWLERGTLVVSIRGAIVAIAVAIVVAIPWYAAMTFEHGSAYLQSFFVGDNFERFATERFNERRPIWFYLPVVLGGLLPWSAYLVAFAVAWISRYGRSKRTGPTSEERTGPASEEWRLILWAGLPLLLFTASVGQQPRYILPSLPPLAILIARSFSRRVDEARGGRDTALAAGVWSTAVLLVVLAILLLRSRSLFIEGLPWVANLGVIALVAHSAVLARIAVTRAWSRLSVVMVTAAATLLLTVQFGAFAGRRPEPVEQVASLIDTGRAGTTSVGQYGVFVRNLVFYTRSRITQVADDEQARAFLSSPERVLFVLEQEDLMRLQATSPVTWPILGRFEYLNSANIRVRDILWPDPVATVRTVVVIANR